MAGRRKQNIPPAQQMQMPIGNGIPAPEMMTPEQQMQLQNATAALQQIDQLNQQTKLLQQQDNNKSHDTEFSPFAEGTGNQTMQIIGENEVKKAYEIMMEYKRYKEPLMNKIADNERFWKMNHWDDMSPNEDDKRIKPKSAWLFNEILNKHADAMDNFPEAVILPRAADDEETAEILSEVIPVILEQNKFQKTYSDVMWYKAKNGTGVYGIFWNNDKNNGLGDIDIKKIDLSHVFWKSGITDIQESPHFFYVNMMDIEEIQARWPNINAGNNNDLLPLSPVDYYGNEPQDQSKMAAVIDWYYRKRVQGIDQNGIPQTKTVVHFCQFCNGQVIYASENDPRYADTGWYAHGKYPFVFDVLYPIEGCAYGIGYIDINKDDQLFVDKLRQAILENAIVNARPRAAVRSDSGLNKEQFLDLSNPLIEFDGNLGEDAFRQIVATPLSPIYMNVLDSVINEMKDTSGNTAATQGQASTVTSASGIASLQEAAGKLSRDVNLSSYDSFKDIVDMVIELIRQFYDEPRCFRITGDKGQYEFKNFDNSSLLPQSQGSVMGVELGTRLPILDIDVKAQKKNAYSKEAQNQTAINLYNLGFFAANNADASLAALDMMDFDGIEKVKDNISQNGTLYDQLMQMQQQMAQMAAYIDSIQGTNLLAGAAAQAQEATVDGNVQKTAGVSQGNRGSLSTQAAAAARNSTSVR